MSNAYSQYAVTEVSSYLTLPSRKQYKEKDNSYKRNLQYPGAIETRECIQARIKALFLFSTYRQEEQIASMGLKL